MKKDTEYFIEHHTQDTDPKYQGTCDFTFVLHIFFAIKLKLHTKRSVIQRGIAKKKCYYSGYS